MRGSSIYVQIFFCIVVVAIVIGVVFIISGGFAEDEPPVTTPPATDDAVPPSEPVNTPDSSPDISEEPIVSPTPTVPVTPVTAPPATPVPTPTPKPVSGSGSFRSNTGTGLNMVVDYKIYSSGGDTAQLQLDISIESYSFYTSALGGSVVITVDGETYSLSSPQIAYDGTALKVTPVGSKTVNVKVGSTVSVDVDWNYRGTYSGKELEVIEANGSIWIG